MSYFYSLYLNIHGAHTQVKANSSQLILKLKNELHQFVTEKFTNNNNWIKIYFQVLRSFTLHKFLYRYLKKGQFANVTEQIFSYIDLGQLTTFFYANKNWRLEEAVILVIGNLGYLAKLKLSTNKRVTVFHAASFSINNKGILLLGNSAAGKTSLSFLCCLHKFIYLSDEDSFVLETKNHDNMLLLGFQRYLRLADHITSEFNIKDSESQYFSKFNGFGEGGYIYAPLNNIPKPDRNWAALHSIFLLNNEQNRQNIELKQANKSDSLKHLFQHCESAFMDNSRQNGQNLVKKYNRQSFEIINEMVERYTVYQLNYNIKKHFKEIPRLLKQAVVY